MNDEFERIWKEAAVALSKYRFVISLEGLSKLTKDLSQDSGCSGGDSNQVRL
jgi:hypothetical protein